MIRAHTSRFLQPPRVTTRHQTPQSQFAPLIITFVRTAFTFRAQPQFVRAIGMATAISGSRRSPRARCLTLTLPPDGGGPGSLHWFAQAHFRLPFRYPRARFLTPPRSNVTIPDHALGCSMFARGSGIQNNSNTLSDAPPQRPPPQH